MSHWLSHTVYWSLSRVLIGGETLLQLPAHPANLLLRRNENQDASVWKSFMDLADLFVRLTHVVGVGRSPVEMDRYRVLA